MGQTDSIASPGHRLAFVIVSAAMLALWGWSLVPPIQNWGNPNEDGFSYVPAFYATLVCLPCGLILLAGAIAGRGAAVARTGPALIVGCGTLFIVVAFLIFQYVANTFGGLGLG